MAGTGPVPPPGPTSIRMKEARHFPCARGSPTVERPNGGCYEYSMMACAEIPERGTHLFPQGWALKGQFLHECWHSQEEHSPGPRNPECGGNDWHYKSHACIGDGCFVLVRSRGKSWPIEVLYSVIGQCVDMPLVSASCLGCGPMSWFTTISGACGERVSGTSGEPCFALL